MNEENTMTFSLDKEKEAYHYRKKRRKVIKLLISMIIWVVIVVYLITPFSTYKMMHVRGNVYLKESEVLELSGIKNIWWWLVDKNKLKDTLEAYENIDNVSISTGFNGLNISILERYPLAIRDGKYLMNTSAELIEKDAYPYHIDKLIDISEIDEQYTSIFASQYLHVNLDIREIFYRGKTEKDKVIILFGKLDDVYFQIKLNIDNLAIKLKEEQFANIKREMLAKIRNDEVKCELDNQCLVDYNLTGMYEYRIN